MIIVCPSCQARYKFDESKLGQRAKAKTKCSKCGSPIEIENPLFGALTLPPTPEAPQAPPTLVPGMTTPQPSAQPPEESTRKTKTIDPTLRGQGRPGSPAMATSQDLMESGNLELSPGKRYSLAVLQGASTGQIFHISKPRVVLGRAGSDINLDDAEASRQHAAVEILGDHAILRDLGSTNGTFADSQRIQQHVLTNQTEFRIGTHVLMFIVTEVE